MEFKLQLLCERFIWNMAPKTKAENMLLHFFQHLGLPNYPDLICKSRTNQGCAHVYRVCK